MIQVYNLTKWYGNILAVDGISFAVGKGEIFGLIGSNGAGKSTTLSILAGVLTPTDGTAFINGIDVTLNPIRAKEMIGFVPEFPALYERLTGEEFLLMVGKLRGIEESELEYKIENLSRMFELDERLYTYIGSYSKGMRQKLAIASAIIHEPDVLLLDEPTTGLDPRFSKLVKDWIVNYAMSGRTVLISTHIVDIAEKICNRIAIIERGRIIINDTPERIKEFTGTSSLEDAFVSLVMVGR